MYASLCLPLFGTPPHSPGHLGHVWDCVTAELVVHAARPLFPAASLTDLEPGSQQGERSSSPPHCTHTSHSHTYALTRCTPLRLPTFQTAPLQAWATPCRSCRCGTMSCGRCRGDLSLGCLALQCWTWPTTTSAPCLQTCSVPTKSCTRWYVAWLAMVWAHILQAADLLRFALPGLVF